MAKALKPADDDDPQEADPGDPKKSKDRSPNYPVVGLEKAVELADRVEKKYGSHDVPINLVQELWDYKPHSGMGNQAIAALKAYGLMAVEGKGEKRKVSLTPEALRIIHNAPDRPKLLQLAAKSPKIHQELLEAYKAKGLPDDSILSQQLVWDRPEGQRFNRDTVGIFIDRFKKTLAYAGVESGGKIDDAQKDGDDHLPPPAVVKAGDYVQWTSGGVEQFPAPLKVVGVSPDGEFAFVQESTTGLPMAELTVVDPVATPGNPSPVLASAATKGQPPANPFYKSPSLSEVALQDDQEDEKTNLDEGPVSLRWPKKLSEASVDELEYWFEGLIRRARRKAGLEPIKKRGEVGK